jgi:hypothetical protein
LYENYNNEGEWLMIALVVPAAAFTEFIAVLFSGMRASPIRIMLRPASFRIESVLAFDVPRSLLIAMPWTE